MDKPTATAAIVAAVTGLFSAGAFKFYEFMSKQKREKLEEERDEHLTQIIQLMTEVSALKVEVDYVKRENEMLKIKIDALR